MTIISFTAASGSGKTTIVDKLLKYCPDKFIIIPSYTTRKPEDRDLIGEYVYLSFKKFRNMLSNNDFKWDANPHENLYYGTTIKSLDSAFNSNKFHLMSVVPQVMQVLYDYAQEKNSILIPFYIEPPKEKILRERLLQRGDSNDSVNKRIKDCKKWESTAKDSNVPFIYIQNNGTIDEAIIKVLTNLI